MNHPLVFLSHASGDSEVAQSYCRTIEEAGLTCWIAPRDVLAGRGFDEQITHAISNCKVFVLVYSKNSQQSDHVHRELVLASNRGRAIVPVRIDDIPLAAGFEYWIGATHWIDVFKMDRETFEKRLLSTLSSFEDRPEGEDQASLDPASEAVVVAGTNPVDPPLEQPPAQNAPTTVANSEPPKGGAMTVPPVLGVVPPPTVTDTRNKNIDPSTKKVDVFKSWPFWAGIVVVGFILVVVVSCVSIALSHPPSTPTTPDGTSSLPDTSKSEPAPSTGNEPTVSQMIEDGKSAIAAAAVEPNASIRHDKWIAAARIWNQAADKGNFLSVKQEAVDSYLATASILLDQGDKSTAGEAVYEASLMAGSDTVLQNQIDPWVERVR